MRHVYIFTIDCIDFHTLLRIWFNLITIGHTCTIFFFFYVNVCKNVKSVWITFVMKFEGFIVRYHSCSLNHHFWYVKMFREELEYHLAIIKIIFGKHTCRQFYIWTSIFKNVANEIFLFFIKYYIFSWSFWHGYMRLVLLKSKM